MQAVDLASTLLFEPLSNAVQRLELAAQKVSAPTKQSVSPYMLYSYGKPQSFQSAQLIVCLCAQVCRLISWARYWFLDQSWLQRCERGPEMQDLSLVAVAPPLCSEHAPLEHLRKTTKRVKP